MNIYDWQEQFWMGLTTQQRGWPNALLIKGRKGIGKLAFGQALSQYLLCENPIPTAKACVQCQSCLWYASGNHPDFRSLEPAALSETDTGEEIEEKKKEKGAGYQISVEQVRALDDFVNLTSHHNGYKVILIYPAETMNPHAANALLKTLEEPPQKTIFLLVSHRPQRLLPTIVSRCHSLAMPIPSKDTALRWLQEQGVSHPETVLSQAGFAPLAALAASGAQSQMQRQQFLAQISTANDSPLTVAENALQFPLADVVNWLQKWVCDLAYYKFTGEIRYHLDFADTLRNLAERTSALGLMQYYRELLTAQRAVEHPLNAKLVLEQLTLSYCNLVTKNE